MFTERKSLRGSGNTILQESGRLLHSGDQIPWWQCQTIKGKDIRYKLYWSGNDKCTAGVGVFVAEEWIKKVFEVQSLRQNHLSENYCWPVCGYLCVCVCPTEWSKCVTG